MKQLAVPSLSLQIRNTWQTRRLVHRRTHGRRNTLMTHKSTRAQIFRQFLFVMCEDTAHWVARGPSHLSFALIFFFLIVPLFYFALLFSLCSLLFSPSQPLPHRNWYRHPWPAAVKLESRCLWHAYILTCARIAHDTIRPQEKLWARTGRKTLENQDTIWHLWSLNDFLLGVGLRPTGKSQKTGRENYIRENVYAAHSAPLLFAPQMSDYSSTLNFWGEGDSFHH